MFGFARPVHNAAHDRDIEIFNAGVSRPPLGHFIADEILDVAREFLKEHKDIAVEIESKIRSQMGVAQLAATAGGEEDE